MIGERAIDASGLVIPSENQARGHGPRSGISPFIDFVAALGITHISHGRARPSSAHIGLPIGVTFPHPDLGSIGHTTVGLKEYTNLVA